MYSRIIGGFVILVFLLTYALSANPAYAAVPRLYFNPAQITTPVSQTFSVDVMIDTAGNEIGGVGARLTYNPQQIAITGITPGTIFGDYPAVSYDNVAGKATISGVVSSIDNLYTGTGSVATVAFVLTTSQEATVTYDFSPGNTKDSNIAVLYGSGDILEEVGTLTVRPPSAASGSQSSPTRISSSGSSTSTPSKTANAVSYVSPSYARPTSIELEPLGPLPSQSPITDPRTQQSPAKAKLQTVPYQAADMSPVLSPWRQLLNKSLTYIPIISAVAVVLLAVGILWYILHRKRQGSSTDITSFM